MLVEGLLSGLGRVEELAGWLLQVLRDVDMAKKAPPFPAQ